MSDGKLHLWEPRPSEVAPGRVCVRWRLPDGRSGHVLTDAIEAEALPVAAAQVTNEWAPLLADETPVAVHLRDDPGPSLLWTLRGLVTGSVVRNGALALALLMAAPATAEQRWANPLNCAWVVSHPLCPPADLGPGPGGPGGPGGPDPEIPAVPLPASAVLLLGALGALGGAACRRARR